MAVLILALCVVAVSGFLGWLSRSSAFTDRMGTACGLGQAKIEELLTVKYSDMASGNDTVSGFTRQWTVTTNGSLKILDVTVNWSSYDGAHRSITLTDAIGR